MLLVRFALLVEITYFCTILILLQSTKDYSNSQMAHSTLRTLSFLWLRGPGGTVLGLTGPGVKGYWGLRVGVGVDEESCNEESWGEDSCE